MSEPLEFDWGEQNTRHLKSHRVSPREFEQLMENNPLDLEYQVESGEERYKSLGITDQGRLMIAVWTLREGKMRAVTAYPAGESYRKLFQEIQK